MSTTLRWEAEHCWMNVVFVPPFNAEMILGIVQVAIFATIIYFWKFSVHFLKILFSHKVLSNISWLNETQLIFYFWFSLYACFSPSETSDNQCLKLQVLKCHHLISLFINYKVYKHKEIQILSMLCKH